MALRETVCLPSHQKLKLIWSVRLVSTDPHQLISYHGMVLTETSSTNHDYLFELHSVWNWSRAEAGSECPDNCSIITEIKIQQWSPSQHPSLHLRFNRHNLIQMELAVIFSSSGSEQELACSKLNQRVPAIHSEPDVNGNQRCSFIIHLYH